MMKRVGAASLLATVLYGCAGQASVAPSTTTGVSATNELLSEIDSLVSNSSIFAQPLNPVQTIPATVAVTDHAVTVVAAFSSSYDAHANVTFTIGRRKNDSSDGGVVFQINRFSKIPEPTYREAKYVVVDSATVVVAHSASSVSLVLPTVAGALAESWKGAQYNELNDDKDVLSMASAIRGQLAIGERIVAIRLFTVAGNAEGISYEPITLLAATSS